MDAHRRSSAFPPEVIAQIQRTAAEGHYEIRGWGAKRALPTFDDLLFLTASLTRYPLEGYREKCDTSTVLGTRYASKPLELAIPVTIAGMSFGALSATAKVALGRAASAVGTSTTTGDGGMIAEERAASRCWSTSACRRATGSTSTTCARPTPSRSSSARAPSRAAAGCCSGRR